MSDNNEVTREELPSELWGLSDETVERLLSKFTITRKPEPFPSEPGTLWLDKDGDVWKVDDNRVFYCVTSPLTSRQDDSRFSKNYAPFRRLVVAE